MRLLSKLGLLFAGLIMFAIFFIIGASITKTTPQILVYATGLYKWSYEPQDQTVVYYSDGQEMDRIGNKRIYSEDYPQFLKDAVVAVEDKRFYQHSGLDAQGIGRAIWTDIKAGRKAEGASTITQQLARTLFLTQEKTYTRKIKEIFYATALEQKFGKDAILNMYLNEIYMGRGCSGMACASKSYFGKDVYDLNKAEMTMLVGIIAAPEYYSPDRNMEAVKERQSVVVDVLVQQGVLSSNEGEIIKNERLDISSYEPSQTSHPYYMAYLTQKLEEVVGAERLYHGGLRIYTTLDKQMQNAAESAVKNQARSLANRGITARDMALVSIDPNSGGIKAFVGGVDFNKNQNNMAVSPRQPGSTIKPLYYAAAMDEGLIDPDTELNNKTRYFNDYLVKNNGRSDKVTVRDGLVYSLNVASVEVLNKLGVDDAASYIEKFGITTLDDNDNNLAALGLGGMTRGISPIQMASAYSVFTNQGERWDYYTIDRIMDISGDVIYTSEPNSDRVISSYSASQIDDILKDVVKYGTGTNARISISSGGKTGTTDDSHNLWYVGYTSELVTAVWAGNSDGSEVKGSSTYGGSVCAPVWRNYMNSLISNGALEEKQTSYKVEETPVEQPTEQEQTPSDETTDQENPNDSTDTNQTPGEQGTPTEPVQPTQPEQPNQNPAQPQGPSGGGTDIQL